MHEDTDRAHIDALAKRYMGAERFGAPPEEIRVRFKIRPDHVTAAEMYAPAR
jgi:hypothetical protein